MNQLAGLCGVVSIGDRPAELRLVDTMVARVPHRTRGGIGRYADQRAAFAQLRRRHGATASPTKVDPPPEPWVDPLTGIVVVADARIDNGDELRRTLGRDAPPSESGPLPLIGMAYRRWGLDCLPRLVGDFALAIWDPTRQRLALARDPMAMRALYYRVESERILVATEVKQILAIPGVPAEPDERMVACYLAGCFGDLEWSYWKGISQVKPSHVTVWAEGTLRTLRFWDVEADGDLRYSNEEDYAEHLRELYLEAVRARLPFDQPSGVLLSGGVDSGALASSAGWILERAGRPVPLYSYSWDYGRFKECDERSLSSIIVRHYGLRPRDVFVGDAGPLSEYPDHAPDIDDPFHSHFHTPFDRTFRRAEADGVARLFTGMRGDLALGPMDMDYESILRSRDLRGLFFELNQHARVADAPPARIGLQYLGPLLSEMLRPRRWARWMRGMVLEAANPGQRRTQPREIRPWISPDLATRVDLPELLATYRTSSTPPLAGPLRRRRHQWLFMPMHLRWSVVQERMTAAYGMEACDAWSDRRIAEFCVAIPQQIMGIAFSPQKRLTRAAMKGIMPEEFRQRSRKTLPQPLFDHGLRSRAHTTVQNLLEESKGAARGWLDPVALGEALARVGPHQTVDGSVWWGLSLEWWIRQIDGAPSPVDGHLPRRDREATFYHSEETNGKEQ